MVGQQQESRPSDSGTFRHAATPTPDPELQRLSFLAEAGAALTGSLDHHAGLRTFAKLAVPRIADWCAVDLLDPGGAVQRLVVEHVDSSKVSLSYELDERYPSDPLAPVGVPFVLRTGKPDIHLDIPDILLQAAARDEEHLRILRSLGLRSVVTVPLQARGTMLGALTLVMAESGRTYSESDLLLADELAGRAALAIDNALLYQAVQEEIVERKRVEGAFRETEARLQLALDAASMGAWDWNMETGDLKWSRNLEPLHGIAPGSFGGTFEAFLEVVHPDDRELLRQSISKSVLEGTGFEVEFRNPHPDGTLHWISGKGQALRNESGKPVRMIGMGLDVTARRELEEEMERRAADLAAADTSKDRFLAVLSHELRTPLGAITNALHLLRRQMDDQPELQRPYGVIERQLNQVTRLVDDLRDVSRLQQGKLHLDLAILDLRPVVEDAVESVRSQIDERRQVLDVSLPETPLWIKGDSTRLMQILCNLLTNASKYTDTGGSIRLVAQTAGDEVVFSVADNGIGIPEQLLSGVFELFFQESASIRRSQGGLGLGLALVKGLVEAHGGAVRALSEGSGRGSEFVVQLPATLPEAP